jgi:hypothetical protein
MGNQSDAVAKEHTELAKVQRNIDVTWSHCQQIKGIHTEMKCKLH